MKLFKVRVKKTVVEYSNGDTDNEYLLTRLGWPVGCYVNKPGEVPRFCVVPVFCYESVAKAMAWYLNNKCEVYKGLDIVPTCQYEGNVEEIRFAVVRHTEDAYTDEQTIWGAFNNVDDAKSFVDSSRIEVKKSSKYIKLKL